LSASCRKGLSLQLEFSDEQFERIYKKWVDELETDNYGGDFDDPVEELFVYHDMDNIHQ
jgi:hypothetical protein